MPSRIQRIWDRIQPSFSKAAAFLRNKAGNCFLTKAISSHPLGARFLRDPAFRSGVILFCSLRLNFTYGVLQLLVGIYARSVWLGALAAYHILLALMQFGLSGYTNPAAHRNPLAELRQSRLCGIALSL